MLHEHPTQVRADLQRFFHLTLDRIGSEFSAYHAASCIACVPADSALVQVLSEEYEKAEKAKETGLDTEAVPVDEFNAWYSRTENFKEVENWQRTL